MQKRTRIMDTLFAAVGFETTTPVYALLVQEALEQGVKNLRLLTSLKVMAPRNRLDLRP